MPHIADKVGLHEGGGCLGHQRRVISLDEVGVDLYLEGLLLDKGKRRGRRRHVCKLLGSVSQGIVRSQPSAPIRRRRRYSYRSV